MTAHAPSGPWTVRHRDGSAAELHALELAEPTGPEVWVLTPDRPALVLGSTQAEELVDPQALADRGIDLVRRRSGGGAVLLDPTGTLGGARTLWVDLVLPRSDPRWTDDVGRSMDWLGEVWVDALGALGVSGSVHRGALERSASSTLVCFAGLGPGEVVVDGRKVVGISQRRTRAGARFQCVVHLADDTAPDAPDTVVDLLVEPRSPAARRELGSHLRRRTAAPALTSTALIDALVAALPRD